MDKIVKYIKDKLGISNLEQRLDKAEANVKQIKLDIRDLCTAMDKLEDLVKKKVEMNCDNCNRSFLTYPYGGGYYKNGDGSVACSNACMRELVARRQDG